MAHNRPTLTWYLLLAPRSVPSFSQVTMGLGFPKAVQVMVTLPPSLASMYWGGVSVKVGGAARDPRRGGGAGAAGQLAILHMGPCSRPAPQVQGTPEGRR